MDCLEYYSFVIYGWLKLLSKIVFKRILFEKFVKSIRMFYFDVKRKDWNKREKVKLWMLCVNGKVDESGQIRLLIF